LDSGLFVYGANNPGPFSFATEGGLILTDNGDMSGGYYVWYRPSMNLEDIDVKMVAGKPLYLAAGHELYNRSVIVHSYDFPAQPMAFDSVRTGTGRYYRAVRIRNDLAAFAAGGNSAGDGIIDMSVDTGSTWANIAVLPGQPVSRLHFVNNALGFAATGGYSRLNNDGILLPDSGAIYRTTNGGLNWLQIHADATNGFSDVAFSSATNGVATRNDGVILRTTNGGDTWNVASVTLPGPFVMTSVTFRQDGAGFATCYRTDGTSGFILLSEDDGAMWNLHFSTASFNHSRRIYDLYFYDSAHGYASTQIRPLRTNGIVTEVPELTEEGFAVFPNPCTDIVTVKADDAVKGSIHLVDALGRVVRTIPMMGGSLTIDVHDLPTGNYVVRVTTAAGSKTTRLLRM